MTTQNEEIRKEILLKDEITAWARNYGLDDGANLSAEEAYEMLEDGVLHFLSSQRQRVLEEVRETIINALYQYEKTYPPKQDNWRQLKKLRTSLLSDLTKLIGGEK